MTPSKPRIALLCSALFISILVPAASHAAASCADPVSTGGDWASYGHDFSNTRSQPDEHSISSANAGSLAPKWTASLSGASLQATPVVADGCVFLSSGTGTLYVLNADNGQLVWSYTYPDQSASGGYGGLFNASVAVAGGIVYVPESVVNAPAVLALNESDGSVLWETRVDDRTGAALQAAPVLYDGMVLQGFYGNEAAPGSRGGFAILDATSGHLLKKTYTISDAEYAAGYQGASIWTTPVVDAATGFAYAGGGNPTNKKQESRYANAMLKIDLNRTDDTFGQVVAAYKGTEDSFVPSAQSLPVCNGPLDATPAAAAEQCVQADLDFGASPTLFKDRLGRTILGDVQKSGVYHALFADDMEQDWTQVVGAPCALCNAASPAVDAQGNVYAVGTPPGQLWSFADNGGMRWVSPIGGLLQYQPVSLANGVAYTTTTEGMFLAYDTSTGQPLLARAIEQDLGAGSAPGTSLVGGLGNADTGVAIARNTVYVPLNNGIVAYALP